jgi:arabinose-5-phosphate isomerase
MHHKNFTKTAFSVIDAELTMINELKNNLNDSFERACRLILECKGHVILMGLGKSGHIARKISATFASTGTPSFFMHASEANHGDLGMVTSEDIILAISASGETGELINALQTVTQSIIAITKQINSSLSKRASITLLLPNLPEACSLGLAPTSSTTASLVLGDALAISIAKARNFTQADFVKTHPQGNLGLRLTMKVADVMHTGASLPICREGTLLSHALLEMSRKRLGVILIVDARDHMVGIFTDGDLRRAIDREINLQAIKVEAVMNPSFKKIDAVQLASEALMKMESYKITVLPILDEQHKPQGVIHIHDLLSKGITVEAL